MRCGRSIGVIAMNLVHRLLLEGAPLWLFALPIVIIFILGVSMRGALSGEFIPAEPYRVAVAGDRSAPAQAVTEALGAKPELFTVARAAGPAEARRSVLAREADAALIVPARFPDEPIAVVAPPGGMVAEILQPVVRAAAAQASLAGTEIVNMAVTEVVTPEKTGKPGRADFPWSSAGSFQYFGIGLTVMFAMFGSHAVMTYCARDRASGAYARIRASGLSLPAYLVAGFVGAVLMGSLFIAFMRVATALLFGVVWGPPLACAALSVAGAAGTAAMSFVVMSLAPRNPRLVDQAGGVLFMLLAFAGGSSLPLPLMPDWFARGFAWLPNRAMLDGYFELATGGGLSAIADELRILVVATLTLFAVAWVISSCRAAEEA
ncbi:ABC transporter permease [Carboxydochorda subterranea]|uniref:ABC transporter permease n=1 Tax=Carboxydichorda subterranea TaxID=3109565 RepID=A0ABZ1BXT6_9FIRM|nr:ABC transporter permease [Limnochorda sp. L945t]WRP17403.1 ABC transporter permease [Limnochorda sp. L945t]